MELLPKRLTGGEIGGIIDSRQYDDILQYDGNSNFTKEDYNKAVSVIPEKLRNELGEFVTRIYIGKDDEPSSYNPEKHEIRLNPKTGDKSIVHELGHAFGDMNNLYNDPEFLDILSEGLKLDNWGEVEYIPHPYVKDEYVYVLNSPKFVTPYQGRIYSDIDTFDWSKPIEPKDFKEYISVGFQTYFNDPELLKANDSKLHDYLEAMINGRHK